VEQEAYGQVDRQPRQVEQRDRARAGKKSAHGVEIADRLCAFAPAAEPQRQAHDRIIDAQTERLVEAVADTNENPAADCVDDALRGVECPRQNEQRDERGNTAARDHPVVDFEHEQRAGEHQNVAHAAEHGDGDKSPPAGGQGRRKLCRRRRLPRQAGELAHAGGAYHLGALNATTELIRDFGSRCAMSLPGIPAMPRFVSILFPGLRRPRRLPQTRRHPQREPGSSGHLS